MNKMVVQITFTIAERHFLRYTLAHSFNDHRVDLLHQASLRVPVLIVAALGITQITGYGTLYYSYSILAPDIAVEFGLNQEQVFGFFSAGLLAGGLSAPKLGQLMDRFGASRLMALGSALSALLLVLSAMAPGSLALMAGVVATQIIAGSVLYQAAFAALVEHEPQTASRSITYLTLMAGFASSIFWPVTTELNSALGWRQVYLVYAGLNLLVCLPIHAVLMRGARHGKVEEEATPRKVVIGILPEDQRRRALVLVSLSFALTGFALSSLLVHMVPMLGALGLGAMAVTVGAIFGPAQVASRLVNMVFGERLPPTGLAMLSTAFIAGGGVVLAITDGSLVGAFVFATFVGLGSGIGSIAQGSVPLYLFGSAGYGAIAGRMTAARLVASSAAPAVFAIGMERLGIPSSLLLNAALGALGIIGFALVGRKSKPAK